MCFTTADEIVDSLFTLFHCCIFRFLIDEHTPLDQVVYESEWEDVDGPDESPEFWIADDELEGTHPDLQESIPLCGVEGGPRGCGETLNVASVEQSAHLFRAHPSLGWIFPLIDLNYEYPPIPGVREFWVSLWISDNATRPYHPTNDSLLLHATLTDVNGRFMLVFCYLCVPLRSNVLAVVLLQMLRS